MKKLLVIAPQNPYPAKDGGKISIYYPLINLAKYFQIHFVFTYFQPLPQDVEEHFEDIGIKIYPQKVNTKDSFSGVLLNIISSRPYKFHKYHKGTILKKIGTIVQKEDIKFIWCNHSHVAWYGLQLQRKFEVKIFLREHNIEYSLVQQVMKLRKNKLLKAFIQLQYLKTKNHEIHCWKTFDKTFFISDSDFSIAKNECDDCERLDLLYDTSHQRKERHIEKKEPCSFIFTGNVETFQNCHNLQRFITEIWEPLIKVDARWKLYITGNKDGVIKKKINTNFVANNIVNLGFVNEIEQAIDSKKYFISPSYIGSGLRIKVVNAMAGGAVCFLSTLDAHMLSSFRHFDNIIKFDNFNTFYENLIRLENDELLYNSISLQASKLGTDFTWEDYALKVYNEITRI
ncbi:MAG TPA: glycosyltransferase [Segetibacter sp.]|nr:glycosyltransferase [Segetibacter sp.]